MFTGYARKRALDDSDNPDEDEDVQTTLILPRDYAEAASRA